MVACELLVRTHPATSCALVVKNCCWFSDEATAHTCLSSCVAVLQNCVVILFKTLANSIDAATLGNGVSETLALNLALTAPGRVSTPAISEYLRGQLRTKVGSRNANVLTGAQERVPDRAEAAVRQRQARNGDGEQAELLSGGTGCEG